MEKAQKRTSLLLEVTAVTTANSVVTTFSNGSLFPSLGNSASGGTSDHVIDQNLGLDDLSLGDPFDGNKSRKSSGFSSAGDAVEKSRQYSGYDNKSRNCSGNSISAGLVNAGILNNGSAPVMIPTSTMSSSSPAKNGSPSSLMQLGNDNNDLLRSSGGNQLGLFDLTSSSNSNVTTTAAATAIEVGRLKDELLANRARMASWEEGLQQARNACEVWKKEAAIANKKAELAMKEKENALLKLAQMQKEIDNLSGGPHLHVVRRVQDLKTAPMGVLKTIEWQLRKDLEEVDKVHKFIKPPRSHKTNDIFSGNASLSATGK